MNGRSEPVVLIAPEILNNRSMPSVGVASIGAYLAAHGVSVKIVDAQYCKSDPTPVLRSRPPCVVGISIESRTVARALRLARLAKRAGHTVVVGGVHVSLVGERILQHADIDYAVAGDGELAMLELLEALQGRRELDAVANLIYRGQDGSVRRNPVRNAPLDELPPPDYGLAGIDHIDVYPVVTSRDCPYRCTFCTTGALSRGNFRVRRPEAVVAEIEEARRRFGIRSFIVVDENFSFDVERAKRFCEVLVERRIGLPWTVFEGVRADAVDEPLLDRLRDSNCRWMFFGIETVENAVLRSVHKATRFAHIEHAVDLSRRHGFKIGGFLIVGLPGSSYERDLLAIDWALRKLDKCTFWTAIPYYGTALFEWVKSNGRLLREPVGENLINTQSTQPFFDTPDYVAAQRKRAHAIGNLRSGSLYFVDHMDFELRRKLPPPQRTESYRKRRLIELACRYDPSFLPRLVPGRRFGHLSDPVEAAARMAGAPAEGISADLYGDLGTPVTEGIVS